MPEIDAAHIPENPDMDESDIPDPGSLSAQAQSHPEPDFDPNVNEEHTEPPTATEPKIRELNITQKFIDGLLVAALDNGGPDEDTLSRLRSPPQESLADDMDPLFRLSLDIYLAVGNASQATYAAVRVAFTRFDPEIELLSYDVIKRRIAEITGVIPLKTDMCVNTCLAFTGPFRDLDKCPECGESRYEDQKKRSAEECTSSTILYLTDWPSTASSMAFSGGSETDSTSGQSHRPNSARTRSKRSSCQCL